MIYFKNERVALSEIDIEQLLKVREFQEKLEERGVLYKRFNNSEQFAGYMRLHLSKASTDLLRAFDERTPAHELEVKKILSSEDPDIDSESDTLDEDGFLDLMEKGEESIYGLTDNMVRMAEDLAELNEKMDRHTKKIHKIANAPRGRPAKETRKAVNRAATDMDIFTKRLRDGTKEFMQLYATFCDSFTKAASQHTSLVIKDPDQISDALTGLGRLREALEKMLPNIQSYRNVLEGWPRKVTGRLDRSTRNQIRALVAFEGNIESAIALNTEVEKSLQELDSH